MHQIVGPGLGQFILRTVAVGDADAGDGAGPGPEHVVLAVADHQGCLSVKPFLLKDMADKLALVAETAVEPTAVDAVE